MHLLKIVYFKYKPKEIKKQTDFLDILSRDLNLVYILEPQRFLK